MNFLYLIGEPGSGKSTLFAELLKGREPTVWKRPIPYLEWGDDVIELGGRRDEFGGTDVMALSVQPKASAFVEAKPAKYLLAEGDRLANPKFFKAVEDAGYDLNVVLLETPPLTAQKWRSERAERLQKPEQNPAWVQGRATKVRALAERWEARRITAVELDQRMVQLRALDDPVVQALDGD